MDPFSFHSHQSCGHRKNGHFNKRRRGNFDREMSASQDDEDNAAAAGLIANASLDALTIKPARAKFDQLPYDEDDEDEDDSAARCVGCMYVSAASTSTEEDKDALQQLQDIIINNHNCKCSDRELVNLVHDFYEKEIRQWQDFGRWSKKMIHAHIYIHLADPDIQTAGIAQLLYAQIESLRNCCWQKNTDTGEMTPNAVNIKLLNDLVTKHQTLIEARRKRAK